MNNRLEQYDIPAADRPSGVQYHQLDMRDYSAARAYSQTAPSVDAILGRVSLSDEGAAGLAKDMRDGQIDTARQHFQELQKRAGATGQAGLTKDQLDKVLADPKTPAELRASAKFLHANWDALNTSWVSGPDRQITPYSLNAYKDDAITTATDAPNATEQEVARAMRNGRRKDLDTDRRDRDGRRDPRDRTDDVVVKDGWGWWQVTREYMRVNGIPYTEQAWRREQARLQKLNPDKVDMLHPKDRIRTR